MPGNVKPAVPVGVFPYGLSNAFTEELRLEPLVNDYPDGSSQRLALALNPRRFFTLTQSLRGAKWATLWSFYQAHRGVPFYFYNLRETVPPWTYDSDGVSTFGRYTVVFDGGWSEETQIGKGVASIALREVV